MKNRPKIYGLLAEFDTPSHLVDAAHKAYARGYRKMDAYTPFPIEELWEALGHHHNRIPLIVLLGGIVGGIGGYLLQFYASVIDYPLNIGGRPLHSWPSFIPPAFETTILFAAFSAVLGMLALNRLPQPHHPIFNAPRFALASRDRFFLCIESNDPLFQHGETADFLRSLSPREVTDVDY
jgi:hypothetical protein